MSDSQEEPSFALTIDSTVCSTEILPFDGTGKDPKTLVGLKVRWYYEHDQPSRLELQCSRGIVQFYKEGVTNDWDPNAAEVDYEVCMDDHLQAALETLRGQRGKKTLKILEAVVGQRESVACSFWDDKCEQLQHRVIGIRLEGMDRLGYIFCKTDLFHGGGEQKRDLQHYELVFYNVVLAPRWRRFGSY